MSLGGAEEGPSLAIPEQARRALPAGPLQQQVLEWRGDGASHSRSSCLSVLTTSCLPLLFPASALHGNNLAYTAVRVRVRVSDWGCYASRFNYGLTQMFPHHGGFCGFSFFSFLPLLGLSCKCLNKEAAPRTGRASHPDRVSLLGVHFLSRKAGLQRMQRLGV